MIAMSQCYAAHLMQALHPMHANGASSGSKGDDSDLPSPPARAFGRGLRDEIYILAEPGLAAEVGLREPAL